MSYADKLSIPYVIFLGEDEIKEGVVACKDMKSGEQTKLNTQETIDRIKAGLAELEKGSVIVENTNESALHDDFNEEEIPCPNLNDVL